MSKALSFMRLDFITIKPYMTLKSMLILIGAAVVLGINNSASTIISGYMMMFAVMYSSYPFALGEKNNIDSLYATLPLNKRSIVLGRYGFVVAFDIVVGITAFVFSAVMDIAMQRPFDSITALLTITVLFAVCTFFQSIQLPIYFKLGYTKAKVAAYVPFMLVPLIVLGIGWLVEEQTLMNTLNNAFAWAADNMAITVVVGIAVWAAMMFVSYRLSFGFYRKREF